MIYYYGKATCSECGRKNNALLEQPHQEEHFLVMGEDLVVQMEESVTCQCEYCFHPFSVSIVSENGKFMALANDNEKKQLAQNPTNSMEESKSKNDKKYLSLTVSDRILQFPFEQQPFEVHQQIKWMDESWTVLHSYKKEHSDRDETNRMDVDFTNCYFYEIQNKDGLIYWLEVLDEETENARITEDTPIVSAHETLYNIDESGFKSELLHHQEVGIQYDLSIYQHLSGVQLLIIRKEEEQDYIVLDLLGDDVEKLMEEAESWLHVTE